MYGRQEAAQLRQEFWTRFGQYMSPIPNAEGEKINWINYKTGEKHIRVRMLADNKQAAVGLLLDHPDAGIQQLFYEQLSALENNLPQGSEAPWQWFLHRYNNDGRMQSGFEARIKEVNLYNREHWPRLISFFKEHILVLDQFWSENKYFFEALR